MFLWIFLFIVFLSSLYVVVTRLSVIKFFYAERLSLYLLEILYTYSYNAKRIKK